MIIGLLGNLGRGKTLIAVFLAALFRNETRIDQVVSNFSIDITTRHVKNPMELEEVSDRLDTAIYVIDEMWAWMNAREVQENFDMVDVVLNSRKRGCCIIYTTQSDRQVDPILMDNTDYLVVPFHRESTETDYDHDIVEVFIIEKSGMELVNHFIINAENIYNTYNTAEEISTVSTAEKYEDLMNEYKKRIADGDFNSKKEIIGDIHLQEDVSQTKSEYMTDTIVRELLDEGRLPEKIKKRMNTGGG